MGDSHGSGVLETLAPPSAMTLAYISSLLNGVFRCDPFLPLTTPLRDRMYQEQIRKIIVDHGRLATDVSELADDSDLYAAGLTSLITVNLLLAIEDHFDVEFPDELLSRRTFQSINALSEAVTGLVAQPS